MKTKKEFSALTSTHKRANLSWKQVYSNLPKGDERNEILSALELVQSRIEAALAAA